MRTQLFVLQTALASGSSKFRTVLVCGNLPSKKKKKRKRSHISPRYRSLRLESQPGSLAVQVWPLVLLFSLARSHLPERDAALEGGIIRLGGARDTSRNYPEVRFGYLRLYDRPSSSCAVLLSRLHISSLLYTGRGTVFRRNALTVSPLFAGRTVQYRARLCTARYNRSSLSNCRNLRAPPFFRQGALLSIRG